MDTNDPIIKQGSSQETDPATAAQELYDAIEQPNVSFAVFYCSANYDLKALEKALAERFIDISLIGCTTAGEIGPNGLADDSIVGFTIQSKNLRAATTRLTLDDFSIEKTQAAYQKLHQQYILCLTNLLRCEIGSKD